MCVLGWCGDFTSITLYTHTFHSQLAKSIRTLNYLKCTMYLNGKVLYNYYICTLSRFIASNAWYVYTAKENLNKLLTVYN